MTGPAVGASSRPARTSTLEGIDLLTVADGLIVRNDAVADGMALARQLGLVPEAGLERSSSGCSRPSTSARGRRGGWRPRASWSASPTASGSLRGGVPRTMNVYLLEDEGGGVTLFDAGIAPDDRRDRHRRRAARRDQPRRARPRRRRPPRRGARASACRCSATRPTARPPRSDEPARDYFDFEPPAIPPARWVYPRLLQFWDGGPIEIAGTARRGRRRVAASASCTCPATRPG